MNDRKLRIQDRLFQSTPPGWEATVVGWQKRIARAISIHASRVGGDAALGEVDIVTARFQSTPPGWEATLFRGDERADRCDFNPRLPGGRRQSIARRHIAQA